jgi:UrcA family protein
MIRTVMLSLAGLSLIAAAAPTAVAAQSSDEASARVAYRDLDPSSDQGAAKLYARLWNEAEALCGPASQADMEGPQKQRACVVDAVDRAVQDVHLPRLSALSAARSGRPVSVQTASNR